jgi:cell division protein FtsL
LLISVRALELLFVSSRTINGLKIMLMSRAGALAGQKTLVWTVTITWVFVVVSALMVVYSKHSTRVKTAELQRLNAQLDKSQVELGRLLLEEGTVASYERIDHYSANVLKMRAPNHIDTIWIDRPES